jgi:pilus assembly protein Flp/PilA
MSLTSYLRTLAHQDEGQDLLEYALLIALIAVAAAGAIALAGTNVSTVFNNIATRILPAA